MIPVSMTVYNGSVSTPYTVPSGKSLIFRAFSDNNTTAWRCYHFSSILETTGSYQSSSPILIAPPGTNITANGSGNIKINGYLENINGNVI